MIEGEKQIGGGLNLLVNPNPKALQLAFIDATLMLNHHPQLVSPSGLVNYPVMFYENNYSVY
jgi:hypothetical protein